MITNIRNYSAFISAILLFQLVPGPGTIAILHATAQGGTRAGMGAVFGTLAGDLVYMTAAVSGLAALLSANPALFSVVQWAGIAYLCRFGWNLLRVPQSAEYAAVNSVTGKCLVAFRQALTVGLTNPKVIIFFLSFFPLFMTTDTSPGTLGVMMLHVTLISLLYQTGLVLLGDRVVRRLSGMQQVCHHARRLTGVTLIGFGVKLALDNH
jgi:threonine/homoserine/homoserine lactone efflux protein